MISATILLAVGLVRRISLPVVVLVGVFIMGVLIPFQNVKRANYKAFQENPIGVLQNSLEKGIIERWQEVGEFVAARIDYVRELVYVNRAVEAGMPLQGGKTYLDALYQMVPRMLWRDKPQMSRWSGYDLPRMVGLLEERDKHTSWAVNMFAEATYNYGLWCLLWFVPLVFLLAEGIERLVDRFLKTPQAAVMSNVSLFYLFLGQVGMIFGVTMVISVVVVGKAIDYGLLAVLRGAAKKSRTMVEERPSCNTSGKFPVRK
jgi:hypothetical protein